MTAVAYAYSNWGRGMTLWTISDLPMHIIRYSLGLNVIPYVWCKMNACIQAFQITR